MQDDSYRRHWLYRISSAPDPSRLSCGLILHTMFDVILADGSTQTKLACLGSIHFDGTQPGLILIEEQGTEVLVGMEFLKSFGLTLIVDSVAGTLELHPSEP